MKRKLLYQICREWKSNLWLALELLIVSVTVWFLCSFLWAKISLKIQPMGLDAENCFAIETGYVDADAPGHSPDDETDETGAGHILTLFDRIRSMPEVESAALGVYATPYELNFMGMSYTIVDREDTLMISGSNTLTVSPDYVTVFGIKGADGESSKQLKEILAKGDMLLTDKTSVIPLKDLRTIDMSNGDDWNRITRNIKSAEIIGATLSEESPWSADTGKRWKIGGIANPMRRMEFEEPVNTILRPLDFSDPSNLTSAAIFVRVTPEARDSFRAIVLKESDNRLRSGNRFVSNVTEIASIRECSQNDEVTMIRNFLIIMAFLLVCIFLGLLGTFWFRTQQRTGEIAIRKVCGSSSSDIFRRLIGEGLLILAIVTPAAVAGDFAVGHFLSQTEAPVSTDPANVLTMAAVTFCLLSLMIILGILFPAIRAMRIDPALALKDE